MEDRLVRVGVAIFVVAGAISLICFVAQKQREVKKDMDEFMQVSEFDEENTVILEEEEPEQKSVEDINKELIERARDESKGEWNDYVGRYVFYTDSGQPYVVEDEELRILFKDELYPPAEQQNDTSVTVPNFSVLCEGMTDEETEEYIRQWYEENGQ